MVDISDPAEPLISNAGNVLFIATDMKNKIESPLINWVRKHGESMSSIILFVSYSTKPNDSALYYTLYYTFLILVYFNSFLSPLMD